MRQHLTAVQAAARVCHAHVEGDAVGSQALRFTPGPVTPGVFDLAIGTAGSATLVLQTIAASTRRGEIADQDQGGRPPWRIPA